MLTIWNFNSLFRVCLIFYTYDSATSKSIRIAPPWKKCYSLLRWPCLLQDVLNNRRLLKQASGWHQNHHPSFLRFWNWAERKRSMQPKFVAAQKMLLKHRKLTDIRQMDYQFYYFRHLYSAGSACVLLTIIAWVAHRVDALSLLINILLGSFQLFLQSVVSLSLVDNPHSAGVCQSGGGCIIHAGAW